MTLEPGELEELHTLRAQAYTPGGMLVPADAQRLQELEDRRVARTPEYKPAVAATTRQEIADHEASVENEPEIAVEPPQVPESEPGENVAPKPSALRALLRARWRPLALAAAFAVVLGVGVGWLVFSGPRTAAVPLTAEQQKREAELIASGDYDAGSIRALAVEEDVVVWVATKDSAQRTCLILGNADAALPNCDDTASVSENGLYGSFTVRSPDGAQGQIDAQMLRTAAGEPAVAVSASVFEDDSFAYQYGTEEEVQTAEQLVGAGYAPASIWIVGYDNDVPIWSATESGTQNHCLIYDGSTQDAPSVCAEPEMMQDQEWTLVLNVPDTETGTSTRYEWQSSSMSMNLVIVRGGGVDGAAG